MTVPSLRVLSWLVFGALTLRAAAAEPAEPNDLFFTPDNVGLSIPEGSPFSILLLRAGQGWRDDGGVREPLLVEWPGATRPGRRCEAPGRTTTHS